MNDETVKWAGLSLDTQAHVRDRGGCGCEDRGEGRWSLCAYHRGYERAVQMRAVRGDQGVSGGA